LAYAAEAKPDTAYSKKSSENPEMTTLRRITRSRLNDRLRNEHIRQLCSTPPIYEWILGRWIEWNEHISRMALIRVVKIARDKAPNSKRNIGRPTKRCRQSLETGKEQAGSLATRRRRRLIFPDIFYSFKQGSQIFQTSRSHRKILGARWVT
jgi:hypothetical protein